MRYNKIAWPISSLEATYCRRSKNSCHAQTLQCPYISTIVDSMRRYSMSSSVPRDESNGFIRMPSNTHGVRSFSIWSMDLYLSYISEHFCTVNPCPSEYAYL